MYKLKQSKVKRCKTGQGKLGIAKCCKDRKGTAKKGGLMKVFGFLALATSIANMFGAFGFLNSQCTVEKCTSEATRINWIDIHNIGNEQGWSLPLPELGIPDYVAVASSLLVLILALRRK